MPKGGPLYEPDRYIQASRLKPVGPAVKPSVHRLCITLVSSEFLSIEEGLYWRNQEAEIPPKPPPFKPATSSHIFSIRDVMELNLYGLKVAQNMFDQMPQLMLIYQMEPKYNYCRLIIMLIHLNVHRNLLNELDTTSGMEESLSLTRFSNIYLSALRVSVLTKFKDEEYTLFHYFHCGDKVMLCFIIFYHLEFLCILSMGQDTTDRYATIYILDFFIPWWLQRSYDSKLVINQEIHTNFLVIIVIALACVNWIIDCIVQIASADPLKGSQEHEVRIVWKPTISQHHVCRASLSISLHHYKVKGILRAKWNLLIYLVNSICYPINLVICGILQTFVGDLFMSNREYEVKLAWQSTHYRIFSSESTNSFNHCWWRGTSGPWLNMNSLQIFVLNCTSVHAHLLALVYEESVNNYIKLAWYTSLQIHHGKKQSEYQIIFLEDGDNQMSKCVTANTNTMAFAKTIQNLKTRKLWHIAWVLLTFWTHISQLQDIMGCDMVLGAAWFQNLNPVTWDFSQLRLSFMHLGKTITLSGLREAGVQFMDSTQLTQTMTKADQLFMIKTYTNQTKVGEVTPIEIQQLLEKFPEIIKSSSELPPERSCDHRIPLYPNTSPISVRPYRYPPYLQSYIPGTAAHEEVDRALHNQATTELLIQWSEGDTLSTSWITHHELRRSFPNFDLEDKVNPKDGGMIGPEEPEPIMEDHQNEDPGHVTS